MNRTLETIARINIETARDITRVAALFAAMLLLIFFIPAFAWSALP